MKKYQIPRTDQIRLLDKGLSYPLSLIVAPPGSGKSSLVTQWLETLRDQKFLRINVSPRFSSERTLFAKVISELKTIVSLWDASFFHLFKGDQSMPDEKIISTLLEAFEQIEEDLIFVFDDFHLVTSKRAQSILSQLIDYIPSNIRFVIASRKYPSFPISRFKLENKVFTIDGNDLSLTEREILLFNDHLSGKFIDETYLEGLMNLAANLDQEIGQPRL